MFRPQPQSSNVRFAWQSYLLYSEYLPKLLEKLNLPNVNHTGFGSEVASGRKCEFSLRDKVRIMESTEDLSCGTKGYFYRE
jgi:hypothetical protein